MASLSHVDGVPELAAVLRRLPDELARNALRSTARAGAEQLRRIAYAYLATVMRSRTPREDDVVIRQRRAQKGGNVQVEFAVGPPRRKPELRWLHDGTAPHAISALFRLRTRRGERDVQAGFQAGFLARGRRAVLASRRLGAFFGVLVHHPGQRSHPWLRAAAHSSGDKVMQAMANAMRAALPRQVARLNSAKYTAALGRRLGRLS